MENRGRAVENLGGYGMRIIGLLGGMGSYAACDIFRRILDAFPAEKEWERPRILIDNNCTMPSRVRAILYGEREEQLIREMSESVELLASAGADRILLGCMTAHYFLPRLPRQDKLINALSETRRWTASRYEPDTEIFCLCTEGSMRAGIWTEALPEYRLRYPDEPRTRRLRDFIEMVKQNRVTADIRREFVQYINDLPVQRVLLGCTELAVLLDGAETARETIDPIDCVLRRLKIER